MRITTTTTPTSRLSRSAYDGEPVAAETKAQPFIKTGGKFPSFRALAVRNYRLFFYGQLISMVGTWMQSMVQAWLVYRLTNSALWLGIITFVMQGTAFVTSPFAGYIVDRTERRKLLIWIETLAMLQAFLLAGLVFAGAVQIWEIAVLSGLLGVANSFESTTRHAFAFDLVGKADLPSAISLNAVTINASRIVGPSIAGAIIAALGNGSEGWCFLINGASFIAVIACLWLMRPSELHAKPIVRSPTKSSLIQEVSLGLRYVRTKPQIRNLLIFTTFMAFVGFPYSVIFPVVAEKVLHGGAHVYGWLTGAGGVGCLLGGLTSSRPRPTQNAVWRKLLGDLAGLGVSYAVLAFSTNTPLSIGAAFALGYFLLGSFPMINTKIQTLVDDHLRGRVVSLYTMCFLGSGPLGSLLMGWLSDHWGVTWAAASFGVFCIVAATGAYALRRATYRLTPSESGMKASA